MTPTPDLALSRRNARIAAHPGLNGMPPRWKSQLTKRVTDACQHFLLPQTVDSIVDRNINAFRASYLPGGLDLTATDGEIVEHARRRADAAALILAGTSDAQAKQAIIEHTCSTARVPVPKGDTLDAQVKRLSCCHWWRRQLRRQYARTLENGNIRLHLVQRQRDPYASRDAMLRCLREETRNRLWMESTVLENENGDRFTLQELSERGTSNKAIRRAELMTRIRGMEDYARDHGYSALFATITCPSCYHATLAGSGQGNPAYRGHTPRQAQDYLCKLWGRVRAKLEREGIELYGLRVAEPHHDACPHWHLIVFVLPQHAARLEAIIRHYALEAHSDEVGAAKNRCHFVPIDPDKGSATGYVAKYIAKNIDGYKLELDVTGEPAITASLHVTAWAKTHGIRQFQAFGAGSITLWRELRRIPKATIADAPAHLQAAWQAAQKTLTAEGDTDQRADYALFLTALGGVAIPRKQTRIQLAKVHYDTPGKYGEAMGEKPIGIVASDAPFKVYESTRYTWTRIDTPACVGGESNARTIATDGTAQAQEVLKKSGFALPWTRVNNCTLETAGETPPLPCWMENDGWESRIDEQMRC
ncbi:replication endonuclease [Massilia pseudoviolaceinigra]|uniref:replication endonuclease n=1 Tax=Massilia pseudoviolaceinigra TaxID=3057165 RepID=UPI0027966E54|nr:replication endonuclease [Massilia sp. CCM 9206]MDQ1925094.1 replication endonuclease [Massilia sp. CCM 9206]